MPLDQIFGQPTNTTVNHIEQQCAKFAALMKTTKWEGCHGCLALVIDEEEIQSITSDDSATTDRLDTPPLTPDGLTNSTTLINQTKRNAKHKIYQEDYWKQEAVDRVIVNHLAQDIINPDYIEELENDYIGYANQTIKTIIKHLCDKWYAVTTLERKQALADFIFKWDFISHITAYARQLDRQKKICTTIDVFASKKYKVQTYVKNMYASEMFDNR